MIDQIEGFEVGSSREMATLAVEDSNQGVVVGVELLPTRT